MDTITKDEEEDEDSCFYRKNDSRKLRLGDVNQTNFSIKTPKNLLSLHK